jgi:hypothetical protein
LTEGERGEKNNQKNYVCENAKEMGKNIATTKKMKRKGG